MIKIRIIGLFLLCQSCSLFNDEYIDNPTLNVNDIAWVITHNGDLTIYESDIEITAPPLVLLNDRKQGFRCFVNDTLEVEVNTNEVTSNDLCQNKSVIGIYRQWRKRYTWFNNLKPGKHHVRIETWGNKDKSKPPILASINGTKEQISLKADTVFRQSSKLPVLRIETGKKAILDDPKVKAWINVINPGDKLNEAAIKVNIAIETRGNTSQFFAKKAYAINIEDTHTGLLQLPIATKYILYAPYADKSMLRNALAYETSADMQIKSVPFQYCELIINGDYQGVYILMNRMNDLNALNIDTSSFLIKMDRGNKECLFGDMPKTYPKKRKTKLEMLSNDALTRSDSTLIKASIRDFETSIDHYNINDTQFAKHIDLQSFVNFFIINEWSKNIDAYRLSSFFYYDKESKKWFAGPVWDYNFAFGLVDYENGFSPEGFVYPSYAETPFWWEKLAFNTTFQKHVLHRWKELKSGLLSAESVEKRADNLLNDQKAIDRNYLRWQLLGQKEVWPNYFIGKTHLEEKQYLINWVTQRNEWLDKNWFVHEKEVVEAVEKTKIEIRNSEKWFRDIQIKANTNNISVEQQLEKDAWWKVYN